MGWSWCRGGPGGETGAETPDLATSTGSETTGVNHLSGESFKVNTQVTHTHLAPELSPLMVDERVSKISDHQLSSIHTDNQ